MLSFVYEREKGKLSQIEWRKKNSVYRKEITENDTLTF